MKKKYLFLLYGMLAVLLSCSIVLIACDSGFGHSNPSSNSNPFLGTWTGTYDGERFTMVITDSRWELIQSGYSYSYRDSGIYTFNGNDATFYGSEYGYLKGFISENRLTLDTVYGAIVLYK